MPHANQTIVETGASVRGLGAVNGFSTSDKKNLSSQFPNGPINGNARAKNALSDKIVWSEFADACMRGTINDEGYWGFGNGSDFSRDYIGFGIYTPSIYDFKWKKSGDPTNSFVPNLMSSPGAAGGTGGEFSNQLAPGVKVKEFANDSDKKGSSPFWGEGTLLDPDASRLAGVENSPWFEIDVEEDISPSTKYILGKSGFQKSNPPDPIEIPSSVK